MDRLLEWLILPQLALTDNGERLKNVLSQMNS
jgi:hypothetical protein